MIVKTIAPRAPPLTSATSSKPKNPSGRADDASSFSSLLTREQVAPHRDGAASNNTPPARAASDDEDEVTSKSASDPTSRAIADRVHPQLRSRAIDSDDGKAMRGDGLHASDFADPVADDDPENVSTTIADLAATANGVVTIDPAAIVVAAQFIDAPAARLPVANGLTNGNIADQDGMQELSFAAMDGVGGVAGAPDQEGSHVGQTDCRRTTDAADAMGTTHLEGPPDLPTSAPRDVLQMLGFLSDTVGRAGATGVRPDVTAQFTTPAGTNSAAIDLMRSDDWIASVASDLVRLRAPSDALHFRLHPANLGMMDVALSQQDGQTLMVLRVETIAAQRMLMETKDRLFDAATGNGVDIGDLRIELGTGADANPNAGTGQQARQPFGYDTSHSMTDRRDGDVPVERSVSVRSLTTIADATRYRFA